MRTPVKAAHMQVLYKKADVFGEVGPGDSDERGEGQRGGPEQQHEDGAKHLHDSPLIDVSDPIELIRTT